MSFLPLFFNTKCILTIKGSCTFFVIFVCGLFISPFSYSDEISSIREEADLIISKMSLEQKVGQLFIVGFPYDRLEPKLVEFVKFNKPGAFIFFKRNLRSTSAVRSLTKSLKQLSFQQSGVIPLLAIDQEGGAVNRLPISSNLPSALAFGSANSGELLEKYGDSLALLLINFGFNMNLAPVLDVVDPYSPSMIGMRSFGSEAETVGLLGRRIGLGMVRRGVLPTAKHFPGMGSTVFDPHHQIVTCEKPKQTLLQQDANAFLPFVETAEPTAVMMSHLVYPSLDPEALPALFSRAIVSGLLREEMKFNGIVLTDDLMMEGSSRFKQPEDAALAALKAGVDLVMLTWSFKNQERAFKLVKSAVIDGRLSKIELNEKLQRIIQAKLYLTKIEKSNGWSRRLSSNENQNNVSPEKSLQSGLEEIQRNVLRLNIKRQITALKTIFSKGSICVFSNSSSTLSNLKSYLTSHKAKYYLVNQNTTSIQLSKSISKESCDKKVFGFYGQSFALLADTLPKNIKSKLYLISFTNPSYIKFNKDYAGVVNLFHYHQDFSKILVEEINGKSFEPNRQPSSKTPEQNQNSFKENLLLEKNG